MGGRERSGRLRRREKVPRPKERAFLDPYLSSLRPEGAPFLEELTLQKALLQGPTERREAEG